jgi:hypothetical protein
MKKAHKQKRRIVRTKSPKKSYKGALIGFVLISISLITLVFVQQQRQNVRSFAAPSAGLLVDKPNQSFTSGQYTAPYHIYAAGLNYAKPVGMLLFADGSGESGFSKPDSSYQMGGPTGLIAVAKKHNMILLYPASPNRTCKCWDEGDRAGYSTWAQALVTQVESQYQINKSRVAVGGYSSGGTLESLSWLPSGAAQQTMDAGVLVFIAAGASGGDSGTYSDAFKKNVHMYWSVGDQDEFLTDNKSGQAAFAAQGFQTQIDILPGKTHSRSGEFGPIMDAQITKYIPDTVSPASGSSPAPGSPGVTIPSTVCGGSILCVPSNSPSQTPSGSGTIPSIGPSPAVNLPETSPSTSIDPSTTGTSDVVPGTGNVLPPGNDPGNGTGKNGGLLGALLSLILLILKFLQSLF